MGNAQVSWVRAGWMRSRWTRVAVAAVGAIKKGGVADADIELMLKKNPARILGLEG